MGQRLVHWALAIVICTQGYQAYLAYETAKAWSQSLELRRQADMLTMKASLHCVEAAVAVTGQ